MTHAHQVEVIILGNSLRKIRRLGLSTMTILSRNRVVEIARRVSRSFWLQPLHHPVFHPLRTGMTRRDRAPGSKSLGSVSGTKTYPTCPKCGKNHSGECLAGKEGCFGCGQSCHMLRDCSSRQGQLGGNGRAQSTTSAAPASHQTKKGNSSGTGSGQCKNKLYALQDHQDQEGSPDVGSDTLPVFDLDVYALLDPRVTLSFVTPYIAVQFDVSQETLSVPFSVSTPIGDPVIARRVYKNCPVIVSQKVTSADLVELGIVDFDVILGMDWLHSCYTQWIVELGLFIFSF